jgi:hypothetical protein
VLSLLSCKLAAVVIHRMLWCKKKGVLSAVVHAKSCCHDPQNALVKEGVCYPCAVMHASCCHDPQNALVEEGCAIPALPCKLAAVVITECSGGRRVCYPALPCKLAVVIHRMLWCKEGCAILRCCHAGKLLS